MNGGGCPDRRFAIAAVVLATLVAAACSDPAEPTRAAPPPADTTTSTTTTTTEAPTTTEVPSTTVEDDEAPLFEPLYADPALDPEAQVEAAYHHYWKVVMDAYRHGRTDYLDLVYTDEAVQLRIDEIEGFIAEGHHVGGYVEHNYVVNIHGPTEANVIDGYWNHLVKTDPVSGEPISEPSGDQEVYEFRFTKEDGQWRVSRVVFLRVS